MGLRTLERLNRVTSNELSFVNQFEIKESVVNHLEKMLNTKKGSVPLNSELGQDTKKWLECANNYDMLNAQLNRLKQEILDTDQRISQCEMEIEPGSSAQTLVQIIFNLVIEQQISLKLQVRFLSDETFIVNEK